MSSRELLSERCLAQSSTDGSFRSCGGRVAPMSQGDDLEQGIGYRERCADRFYLSVRVQLWCLRPGADMQLGVQSVSFFPSHSQGRSYSGFSQESVQYADRRRVADPSEEGRERVETTVSADEGVL